MTLTNPSEQFFYLPVDPEVRDGHDVLSQRSSLVRADDGRRNVERLLRKVRRRRVDHFRGRPVASDPRHRRSVGQLRRAVEDGDVFHAGQLKLFYDVIGLGWPQTCRNENWFLTAQALKSN